LWLNRAGGRLRGSGIGNNGYSRFFVVSVGWSWNVSVRSLQFAIGALAVLTVGVELTSMTA